MIVDLRTISSESRRLEFILIEDWWHSEDKNDQVVGLETPVRVKIEIYRAGDKLVLRGDLSGRLKLRCDRCLKSFGDDLRTGFEVFLSLPSEKDVKSEIELLEDDMEVEFITGEEIHLDEIIREQIYLSLPLKSLCNETCLGLCPDCGVDLNEGRCLCNREQGHPGFSKLRNLRI